MPHSFRRRSQWPQIQIVEPPPIRTERTAAAGKSKWQMAASEKRLPHTQRSEKIFRGKAALAGSCRPKCARRTFSSEYELSCQWPLLKIVCKAQSSRYCAPTSVARRKQASGYQAPNPIHAHPSTELPRSKKVAKASFSEKSLFRSENTRLARQVGYFLSA